MDRLTKHLEENDEENLFSRHITSRVVIGSHEVHDIMRPESATVEGTKTSKSTYCLPYLQSVLFACILEDVITQIRILDECNNELRIVKTLADKDNLRARKFKIKPTKGDDSILDIDYQKLNSMQFKLDKLAADRLFCGDVVIQTYLELSLNRCYFALVDVNKENQAKNEYIENLFAEEARNKSTRRDIMRQLRLQRNHMKTVTYDTELIIDELKSRVEDAVLNSETRGRYVEKWENARTEQHTQAILDWEKGPSDTIKYYQRRTDQEHRIHSEVDTLVNIFINETMHKVDEWMVKYDQDMEAVDLKIQIMKNKYQTEVERREEMENTYAEHEISMKNWVQFKEDREKAQAYVVKMNNCATIVQSWWRGLLVRLELGPFRPKKGAHRGKKKK